MAREVGWYGWFRDGKGGRYEAYWDGSAWTDRRPQRTVMVSEVAEAPGGQDSDDGQSVEAKGPVEVDEPAGADEQAGRWLIGQACLLSVLSAIIAMPLIVVIAGSFQGDGGADAFGAFLVLSLVAWPIVSVVAAGVSVRKVVGDRGFYLFSASIFITGAVYAVVFVGLFFLIF